MYPLHAFVLCFPVVSHSPTTVVISGVGKVSSGVDDASIDRWHVAGSNNIALAAAVQVST
jgi:hypothetical protein